MTTHYACATNEGENQVCSCGNDTLRLDWIAADRTQRPSPASAGSSDPHEHYICPKCGSIYRNGDLYDAQDDQPVYAIAQLDLADEATRAAIAAYDTMVYGTASPMAPNTPTLL